MHSPRSLSYVLTAVAAFLLPIGLSHAATSLHPRLVPTRLSSADYAIASAVATDPQFGATADGRTDCTQAIQSAIDAVSQIGGGVVFLPGGRYLCQSSLRLKAGVTLRGEWRAPGATPTVDGTILMPTGGRGQADGAPFITIECGACVRNLNIWYPDQKADNVTPYPFAIANDDNHGIDCFTVENVTLVNPYQGVRFVRGSELHVLRNVYGTPLETGFIVDNCGDNGRLVNVHFGPTYWADSGLAAAGSRTGISTYLANNATGMILTRTDCEDLYDISLDGYKVGILATRSRSGFPYGEGYAVRVQGGGVGLEADELNMGLQFTHCRFSGSVAGVAVGKQFGSALQFTDCDLGGATALRSEGGGTIQLQECRLGASVHMDQAGSIDMIDCPLSGADSRVTLAPGVLRALIRGSIRKSQMESRSQGDVQITQSPVAGQSPSIRPTPALPPDSRPSKPLLFDVLDYGAVADATADGGADNTAAFQKALEAARAQGGGTVYAPAGRYRFAGNLVVPTGVELRGSFDGPHHTVSGGTMLFPCAGRGQENGTPFLSLSPAAGVRGLTVWYPDQRIDDIAIYPWTVRALGQGCWLLDFTASNAYQMVDFGSFSSDGSLIRQVFGCALRRGMWVSKGSAVVDGCHFNPHFWQRTYPGGVVLRGTPSRKPGDLLSDFVSTNLDVFTFGDCPSLLAVNDGLCACSRGIRFVADRGRGSGGLVINPASDCTIAGAMCVDQASRSGLRVYNPELIVLSGGPDVSDLKVSPECNGSLYVCSGMSWGLRSLKNQGPEIALLGSGRTIIDGWKALGANSISIGAGSASLRNVDCQTDDAPTIRIVSQPASLQLVGDSAGVSPLTFSPNSGAYAGGNARALPPLPLTDSFVTDFGAGAPAAKIQPLVVRNVTSPDCKVEQGAGRNGAPALVLTCTSVKGDASSAAYYALYDVNLPVTSSTYLRYWLQPLTKAGETVGVDLNFSDGSSVRDLGVMDLLGRNLHPGLAKGEPGKWTMVQALIGSAAAGKTIKRIVFAYEGAPGGGDVKAVLDKIEIGEPAQ